MSQPMAKPPAAGAPSFEIPRELRDGLRAAWQRYLDMVTPFRPVLYGTCRRLTGNTFDAEDLVQETLLRAFGTLGSLHQEVGNPRAYLLRAATHAWIDRLRHLEIERGHIPEERPGTTPRPEQAAEVRDAARTLLRRLPPRERAAVVLKDALDLSLEETALVLETTVGAVKSALHRGRGRLQQPEEDDTLAPNPDAPSAELVDRFVALFNAADKEGLAGLLLEQGTAENVGCGVQYGDDARGPHSWFEGALGGHPDWPAAFRYECQRAEGVRFEGEPVVLVLRTRGGVEALEIVVRLEEREGRLTRLRSYGFCPETVRAVGEALGLEVRTGLYRFPTPAPGDSYGGDPP